MEFFSTAVLINLPFSGLSFIFHLFRTVPIESAISTFFLLRVLRSLVIVAFDLCVNTPFDHQCKKSATSEMKNEFQSNLELSSHIPEDRLSTVSSLAMEASLSRRSKNHSAAADVSVFYAISVGLINRSGIVKAIYAALLKLRDPLGELKDSYFFPAASFLVKCIFICFLRRYLQNFLV